MRLATRNWRVSCGGRWRGPRSGRLCRRGSRRPNRSARSPCASTTPLPDGEPRPMFKIGEFSRIARVSARLLRYYDELGLLKPGVVDATTGYRYYTSSQLLRLNRILVLRDLGFT